MRRISLSITNRIIYIGVELFTLTWPIQMSDTLKIERPLACRRRNDAGGRTKVDATGDTTVIKTRFSDSEDLPEISSLSIGLEKAADNGTSGK